MKNKIKINYLCLALMLVFFVVGINVALADGVALDNPLGSTIDIVDVFTTVIKTIFAFTGILALLQFIYGGLLWLTSGGNQEKITKGKNTLLWAVLGVVVVFMSYALVSFVIQSITGTQQP